MCNFYKLVLKENMDPTIQGLLQSPLARELFKTPHNASRFIHDIKDNSPIMTQSNEVVLPYTNAGGTYRFKLPRRGRLAKLTLRAILSKKDDFIFNMDTAEHHVNVTSSFLNEFHIDSGGRTLEILHAPANIERIHKETVNDSIRNGLMGYCSETLDEFIPNMNRLFSKTMIPVGLAETGSPDNISISPTRDTLTISYSVPLKFSVIDGVDTSLDTDTISPLEVSIFTTSSDIENIASRTTVRYELVATYFRMHDSIYRNVNGEGSITTRLCSSTCESSLPVVLGNYGIVGSNTWSTLVQDGSYVSGSMFFTLPPGYIDKIIVSGKAISTLALPVVDSRPAALSHFFTYNILHHGVKLYSTHCNDITGNSKKLLLGGSYPTVRLEYSKGGGGTLYKYGLDASLISPSRAYDVIDLTGKGSSTFLNGGIGIESGEEYVLEVVLSRALLAELSYLNVCFNLKKLLRSDTETGSLSVF